MAGRLDKWREEKKVESDLKAAEFQEDVDNFNARREGL